MFRALLIGLALVTLPGCATAVSAVGAGVAMAAEYFVATRVSKTITSDFDRLKKALFVALTSMDIHVDKVTEIEEGEEIIAKADDLKITIQLKRITPRVTRVNVKADRGLFKRDKATAQEIIHQTSKITENLPG